MLDNIGELEVRAHNIKTIESKADLVTHDTIQLLHQTFITPLGSRRHLSAHHPHGRHPRSDGGRLALRVPVRPSVWSPTRRSGLPTSASPAPRKVAAAVKMLDNMANSEAINESLRRNRPARDRRRPGAACRAGEAVSPRAGHERADQDEGDLRAAGDSHRPVRGRRQHHRRHRPGERLTGPARRAMTISFHVVLFLIAGRARVRLPERLSRRRQLDRHHRFDRGHEPRAGRLMWAAFFNFVAFLVFGVAGRKHHRQGDHPPGHRRSLRRVRRASRRHRMESHHLVLRHSFLVLACLGRRARRRRYRQGRKRHARGKRHPEDRGRDRVVAALWFRGWRSS